MKSLEEIHPYISIHALLAESDAHQNRINKSLPYFYPRSPCGERQCWKRHKCRKSQKFLSTLSLRRATDKVLEAVSRNGISIHALLAESDNAGKGTNAGKAKNFYPRSPCGERQWAKEPKCSCRIFLSTLSLRRATWHLGIPDDTFLFLSTLSLRRATCRG